MDSAFGTTITFGTSNFSADLLDVTPPGPSREVIDISHMGLASGFKEFMPSDLVDWGEAKLTVAFDPATVPPIAAAAETVTITFPDGTTWAFTGFLTKYESKAPMEDKMTADVTVKVSGKVTISAGT